MFLWITLKGTFFKGLCLFKIIILIIKKMKAKTSFHQLLDLLIEATELEIQKKER